MEYSLNGHEWSKINDGATYMASSDVDTKKTIEFPEVVYARTIRLYPVTWHNSISLRFDTVYLDIE